MVEIFLETTPHMRGTVMPPLLLPLRGGGHRLYAIYNRLRSRCVPLPSSIAAAPQSPLPRAGQ